MIAVSLFCGLRERASCIDTRWVMIGVPCWLFFRNRYWKASDGYTHGIRGEHTWERNEEIPLRCLFHRLLAIRPASGTRF